MRLLILILLLGINGCLLALTPQNNIPVKTAYPEARLSGQVFTFFMQAHGSQYFYEEWLEGRVQLTSGYWVEGQKLRYNAYLDELLWLSPEDLRPIMVDKGLVARFEITRINSTHVFKRVARQAGEEGLPGGIFAEVLHEGQWSLYAHRKVVQKSEVVQSIGGSTFARPSIQPETVYYLINKQGETIPFSRLNSRRFSRLFDGKEREVRRTLREKGLRINDERGLLQAMDLVEGVLQEGK